MDRRLAETDRPDYRRGRPGWGMSLMRHAGGALARPVAALALGVVAPAVLALLVLRPRRTQTHSASLRRTPPTAIPLAAVTIRTQVRIPAERDRDFRDDVNTDSGGT